MTEHLSRAAAATDWQGEIADEAVQPIEHEADGSVDIPLLGVTETIASLRCPVGRVRTRAGEAAALRQLPAAMQAPAGDPERVIGGPARTPANPGAMALHAERSVPLGPARDAPPDIRRMARAFAGRMRGLTDTI